MKDRQLLNKFIEGKVKEIKREYEDYLSSLQSAELDEGWTNRRHHIDITIWKDHFEAINLIDTRRIDGKDTLVCGIYYRDDKGEMKDFCVFAEDIINPVTAEPTKSSTKKSSTQSTQSDPESKSETIESETTESDKDEKK